MTINPPNLQDINDNQPPLKLPLQPNYTMGQSAITPPLSTATLRNPGRILNLQQLHQFIGQNGHVPMWVSHSLAHDILQHYGNDNQAVLHPGINLPPRTPPNQLDNQDVGRGPAFLGPPVQAPPAATGFPQTPPPSVPIGLPNRGGNVVPLPATSPSAGTPPNETPIQGNLGGINLQGITDDLSARPPKLNYDYKGVS